MNIREKLHEIAERLHELWQHESAGLSQDEQTAVLTSVRLLEWAAQPPEAIKIVTKKPAISFGEFTLGGDNGRGE